MTLHPIKGIHRECPFCFGVGEIEITDSQRGHNVCPVCQGRRTVDPSKICECGRPAVLWQNKIGLFYCGRENCLNARKFRLSQRAVSAL